MKNIEKKIVLLTNIFIMPFIAWYFFDLNTIGSILIGLYFVFSWLCFISTFDSFLRKE